MKKIIIYVIAVIAVAILGAMFTINFLEDNNTNETSSYDIENDIGNRLEEGIQNAITENTVNENVIGDETVSEETNGDTEDKPFGEEIDESLTGEEEAKAIVKNDWGADNTVYFTVDAGETDEEKGEYVIYVRETKTTNKIYKYTVNVNTGVFTSELEAH